MISVATIVAADAVYVLKPILIDQPAKFELHPLGLATVLTVILLYLSTL